MTSLNTPTKHPTIKPTSNAKRTHLKKLLFIGEAVSLAHVGRAEAWSKAIPNLREHLQIRRLLDPRPALQQASFTVCHGGSGTVYQSLSQGVPLLRLPHNPDQILTSKAVTRAGVGSTLNGKKPSINKFKTIITSEFLHTTKHQIKARQFAHVLAAWDTRHR